MAAGTKNIDTLTGARNRGSLQSPALDGVRGVAVLFVIFSHLANVDLVLAPSVKFAGIGSGQIGVYLFFSLSSFLLTRGILSLEVTKLKKLATWKHYALRRITRVFPFYIAALLFTVIATQFGLRIFQDMSMSDFWSHLFLLDGRKHFWTIAVEVKFYLLLPFFTLAYRLFFQPKIALYLASTLLVCIASSVVAYLLPHSRISLLEYLPIFATGCVAAVLADWLKKRRTEHLTAAFKWTSLSLFGLLILLMPALFDKITEILFGRELPWFHPHGELALCWGVLSSTFVLTTHLTSEGILHKILCSTIMRFLGAISFSLYINHWFILAAVGRIESDTWVKILLFWLFSILASCVTFLVIEKPLSRIGLRKVQRSAA